VVLAPNRRPAVYVNLTEPPTALGTAQQMIEGFPENTALRYLIRDRDKVSGGSFRRRVMAMGLRDLMTVP
jgi:putative transposase